MKRVVFWFIFSCKRCLRKGIFPFLLVLMPLAAFAAGRISDEAREKIPVAVSVSGKEEVSEQSLALRLAERLAGRKDGMFDFYICSDEAQVQAEVASRRAECGYVIDSGLEEKLDQKKWKRVIHLYIAPSTVAGPVSTETVFSELASLYNRDLLMDYVKAGEAFDGLGAVNGSARGKAAEEAGEIYDRKNQEGGLFHFQYVYETNRNAESEGVMNRQSPQNDGAGRIFPVRGLGAVMIFVLFLYGGVMVGEDERRGLFVPLSAGERLSCRLAAMAAPGALACVSVFCALLLGGMAEEEILGAAVRELGILFLYGCGCAAFVFVLKLIVRSPEILCCMIPFFIIGSFLFCPVFADAGRWIPGMEQLGKLFLPYYYLRCF